MASSCPAEPVAATTSELEGKCGLSTCSIICSNKCSRCKSIYYCCADHQKLDYKGHKGFCIETFVRQMPWSIVQLLDIIKHDMLPPVHATRLIADYGFGNCSDEDQELMLFNVYIELIKILKTDLIKLHEAAMKGNLKEFIASVYEKHHYKSAYYTWFCQNKEVVNNLYTVE